MQKYNLERIIREALCLNENVEELGYDVIPEWSSSSHINVIIALEENLGVIFEADEIVEMINIPSIEVIVAKKLGVQG